MFEIRIADAAQEDLAEIERYLRVELANPPAAAAFLDRVEQAYETLRERPLAFPVCCDVRLSAYRKALVGGYLFVYRVDEAGQVVHIVRFFHQLQDYANLI